ncbi:MULTISPECIES: hypothetical protein [Actinosynnema]|uniref:hypothetical protein n=1 Tax=Actinosynnema TaxID=40566 RepID=UPI0020A45BDF|nr:hypothetical protein [Actinosynnema pretiosum]
MTVLAGAALALGAAGAAHATGDSAPGAPAGQCSSEGGGAPVFVGGEPASLPGTEVVLVPALPAEDVADHPNECSDAQESSDTADSVPALPLTDGE